MLLIFLFLDPPSRKKRGRTKEKGLYKRWNFVIHLNFEMHLLNDISGQKLVAAACFNEMKLFCAAVTSACSFQQELSTPGSHRSCRPQHKVTCLGTSSVTENLKLRWNQKQSYIKEDRWIFLGLQKMFVKPVLLFLSHLFPPSCFKRE